MEKKWDKVAVKWVQMAAAEQEKGEKVQKMRGKWEVFVKKWGNRCFSQKPCGTEKSMVL